MKAIWIAAVVSLASSAGFSQTIYVPTQFQYQTQTDRGARTFYYAGSDPAVFRSAAHYGPRTVENEPARIYSDGFPYLNAARYGYTVDDVRNDANANQPRYFANNGRVGTRY